jgi:prepilin-type N-terminal cleavage/methylation domain-containing protein
MSKADRKPRRCLKTRDSSGFTLVEVLIAMAIIGLTAVVLLDQRIGIVQDAAKARDKRTSWVLASQKLAELELDPTIWTGLGSQNNGDFAEVDPELAAFQWEYQIVRELIDTAGPTDPKKDDPKKRELFRLTLSVRAPGSDEPIVLEAEFPVDPPKPDVPDPTKADPSADPTKTPEKPADGGLKK